jgi:hypothetical protein
VVIISAPLIHVVIILVAKQVAYTHVQIPVRIVVTLLAHYRQPLPLQPVQQRQQYLNAQIPILLLCVL